MTSELIVEVTKTDVTITMPILKPLKTSKSGKSLVVCTTGGNIPTEAKVNGKTLVVGLNAYIKKD